MTDSTRFHPGQRVFAQGLPATIREGAVSARHGHPSPHAEVDYDNGDHGCHVPHSMIEPMPAPQPLPERAAFDALLAEALPLLGANLDAAYREYMEGAIAAGAFRYVRDRHSTMTTLAARPDLPLEQALRAAAAATIDLRTACADAKRPDLLERWMTLFREAGYTAVNPILNIPTLPSAAA